MNDPLTPVTILTRVSPATRHTQQVAASMCGTVPTDPPTAFAFLLRNLVKTAADQNMPLPVLLGWINTEIAVQEYPV